MSPHWQRTGVEPPHQAPLLMDAVLTPHRSLSLRTFYRFVLIFLAINLVIGGVLIAGGAYPVIGFMGLEIGGLWLAFVINYRAARRSERVRVAPDHIHIERRSRHGVDHWVVSSLWARVSRDVSGVRIASGGDSQRVGAFLSPKEQRQFAQALAAAVRAAQRS